MSGGREVETFVLTPDRLFFYIMPQGWKMHVMRDGLWRFFFFFNPNRTMGFMPDWY